jgi:hypothetical protein
MFSGTSKMPNLIEIRLVLSKMRQSDGETDITPFGFNFMLFI